jgi:hypothetical protein
MPDSWRHILERAADNLAIDLEDRPIGRPAQTAPRPPFTRPVARPRTFAETRQALALELEAIPSHAMDAPASHIKEVKGKKRQAKARKMPPDTVLPFPELRPPQAPEKSKKSNNLAVLVVSVSIVALSVYGIYSLLH